MKKKYNYTFRAVCIYLMVLTVSAFLATEFSVDTFNKNILNANIMKQLNSILISQKSEKNVCPVENEQLGNGTVNDLESFKEPEVTTTPTPTETPAPTPQQPQYTYTQTIDTTNLPVLATTSGNVSHYGHDCRGCTSGKTATGYDISDGRIYYTDSTYGSVRVVAAGNEYPFGTILRLSNSSTAPIIAIVLDRGGAIGSGKRYILDLLTESNAAAYQAGVKYNMTIEVLRMGY